MLLLMLGSPWQHPAPLPPCSWVCTPPAPPALFAVVSSSAGFAFCSFSARNVDVPGAALRRASPRRFLNGLARGVKVLSCWFGAVLESPRAACGWRALGTCRRWGASSHSAHSTAPRGQNGDFHLTLGQVAFGCHSQQLAVHGDISRAPQRPFLAACRHQTARACSKYL